MRAVAIDLSDAMRSASAADLAVIGEVAAALDPEDVLDGFDAGLDKLREATGADACELFVTDPDAREMYMVSHRGADLAAFCQRDHFAKGEGFPGLVLRTGNVAVTDTLEAEVDFLRSRVKALQYRGVVCAPLRSADRVRGSVLLAWKRVDTDVGRVAVLAALAARPLGSALAAASARLRLAADAPSRGLAEHAAERLRTLAGADAARVNLLAERGTRHATASVHNNDGHSASDNRRADDACPALCTGTAQVLGGREGWPGECLRAGCVAKARYCIPLVADNGVIGLATLAFNAQPPVPRTRWLPWLMMLGQELPALADRAADAAPSGSTIERRPESTGARLELRCFGGFRIVVDGREVPPSELKRSKACELLALLAASRRPRSGEYLAARLWPGSPLERARNRFHVTLYALRAAIEPGRGRPWTHIRHGDHGFYLDPTSEVFVDLWHYDDLCRHARSAEAGLRPIEEVIALLEQAVVLYEGDVFDGTRWGDWTDAVAARFRDDARHAVARIAALSREIGQPQRAAMAIDRAAVSAL